MKSFIITCTLISSMGYSQNTVEEIRPQELITEIGLENIIPNFGINPAQIQNFPDRSNSIFIDQIGSNNNIKVRTVSQSSAINLTQKGNNNTLRLNLSAMTATENFQQQGDNHYLAAFGATPTLNLERTIKQNGYGQNLTIHGNNELSEKMELNMKGSTTRTIIIRNFN